MILMFIRNDINVFLFMNAKQNYLCYVRLVNVQRSCEILL